MNKLNQKSIFILVLNLAILVFGTLKDSIFLGFSLGYMATLTLSYVFGSKIQNTAMNLGYIWISKWSCFVIFLATAGMNAPNIFLESMFMFVLFNLTINPAYFMKKEIV